MPTGMPGNTENEFTVIITDKFIKVAYTADY
jgi:hypothetical protein